jgi:hypothetical protein
MTAMDKIALLELIREIGLEEGDVDFLREGLKCYRIRKKKKARFFCPYRAGEDKTTP